MFSLNEDEVILVKRVIEYLSNGSVVVLNTLVNGL